MSGLKMKSRQPPGCRISARPGKTRVPPGNAMGQSIKREPSQYNVFVQQYIAENKKADSDIRELFKEAALAWKNRGEGACANSRRLRRPYARPHTQPPWSRSNCHTTHCATGSHSFFVLVTPRETDREAGRSVF